MKKAVKGIIGLTAVAAVLGGGLAALKLTEPEKQEESSSSVSEVSGSGVQILGADAVKSVSVKNSTDEFVVKEQTAASEGASATYTIEGYEETPLDISVVGTLANNLSGLSSTSIVADDCDDLAKYGLESPEVTLEITYASGDKATLLVGNMAPSGSDAYVKTADSNTVYTIYGSKVSNLRKSLDNFISSTILEEPAEDEYPIVESLRVERKDMEYDILLEYDEKSDDADYIGGTSAAHIMTEPTFAYLSVDDSTPITHGLFGLTSEGVYSVLPDEADIAEAGLNDPFCTVTMKCDDGNDYVFLMSESYTDENGAELHYAMFEGGNVIYIVSAENAAWGSVQPIDVASRFVFGSYVWDITDMKLSGSGLEEDIVFKAVKKAEAGSDASEKLSSDDFDLTRNGSVYDAERYREFYAFLIQTAAEDFAINEEMPSGEPLIAVEITDSYTDTTQKVEFYEYSALNVLIAIDGEPKYFCSKSFAETLVENAKRTETGEDYLQTWK